MIIMSMCYLRLQVKFKIKQFIWLLVIYNLIKYNNMPNDDKHIKFERSQIHAVIKFSNTFYQRKKKTICKKKDAYLFIKTYL